MQVLTPISGSATQPNGLAVTIPNGGTVRIPITPNEVYRVCANGQVSMRFANDGSATATADDILLPSLTVELWSAGINTGLSFIGGVGTVVLVTPVLAA